MNLKGKRGKTSKGRKDTALGEKKKKSSFQERLSVDLI